MIQDIVIGAGPYGLSVAAHLAHRGVPARVVGVPMNSWRENMPVGMFLKSSPHASSISAPLPGSTLDDYCMSAGEPRLVGDDPVPISLFVAYGLWFQQRHVPQVERDLAVRITRDGRTFNVELSSGEVVQARNVVMAAGHMAYASMPPELLRAAPDAASPDGPISHASRHADFARFAGKRVVVVGSGQSALESAVLLHEAGAQVELIARTSALKWASVPAPGTPGTLRRMVKPPTDLGPGWAHRVYADAPDQVRLVPPAVRLWIGRITLGPSGSFWLRDRFDGKVPVRLGRAIRAAVPLPNGAVRLELTGDGTAAEILEADHIVAGTGYRIDLDRLGFLDPALRGQVRRTGGAAALDAAFESSVPGLYFTGLAASSTFGPLLRFVAGTGFAASRIAATLAADHRRSTDQQRSTAWARRRT